MAVNPLFKGMNRVNADTPSRMKLLDPVTRRPIVETASGEEAWIDLLALSSGPGLAHDRETTDRMIALKGRRMNAQEIDENAWEKLGKITVGWHLVDAAGVVMDVPFSADNAAMLYSNQGLPWVREQVAEFVNDLGNFRPPASNG